MYGYVFLVAVAFWIQQAVIFVVPIMIQRDKTGIKAPVLYPNDKLVASLKLTDYQVDEYMRAQRVHQYNVEFLCIYFPMFLLSSLENPTHAAAAGALVWLGRLVVAMGYWKSTSARIYGVWFHIPEFYTIFLVGKLGYVLSMKTMTSGNGY